MEIDLRTRGEPVWNIDQWRDVRDRASAKFSGGAPRALFLASDASKTRTAPRVF